MRARVCQASVSERAEMHDGVRRALAVGGALKWAGFLITCSFLFCWAATGRGRVRGRGDTVHRQRWPLPHVLNSHIPLQRP